VDITTIAPFRWDRMYVFAGETRAEIERRLGFAPKAVPAAVPSHEALIVFVRGRQVAASALFSDAVGNLGCLLAQAGYPRGTPFVVRFTRRKAAFLSTAQPDAAERSCLRSAGVR
jgi:hypothetical protein